MAIKEFTDLADLTPDKRNARRHNPRNVGMITDALNEVGVSRSGVIDEDGNILAGNGTYEALADAGITKIKVVEADGKEWVVVKRTGLSDEQKAKLALYDNRTAELADWDPENMADILADFPDIVDKMFSEDELKSVLDMNGGPGGSEGVAGEDEPPLPPAKARTNMGDVYTLGKHRLMCGDSTKSEDVGQLMAGKIASLLHADPPYGMGKEADGVLNDNIYAENLDKFQMRWWVAAREHLKDNASAYIWGNAPDLWRLWWAGGLEASELLELRNQIVWDKKAIPGMASPLLTQYPVASEHCLFFQIGQQFLGNVNAVDFPETWAPLQEYLAGEAEASGIDSKTLREMMGNQMFSHWFSKSQFCLIPENHYQKLQEARPGYFLKPHAELKAEWADVKSGPQSEIGEARSYFDNAHEIMRDVWEFPRVLGEDRFGHATPKPAAMMRRIMISSLPEEGLCFEPFGGTGSTMIGAETSGRICNSMELDPIYCDVIVGRFHFLFPDQPMFLNDKEISWEGFALPV